jgi:hypothetical protein
MKKTLLALALVGVAVAAYAADCCFTGSPCCATRPPCCAGK